MCGVDDASSDGIAASGLYVHISAWNGLREAGSWEINTNLSRSAASRQTLCHLGSRSTRRADWQGS